MDIRALDRIITVKPEPQTTPSLAQAITRAKACETVGDYHFTPSLRAHFQRVFDCIVHRKGQGFWVQAEYGARLRLQYPKPQLHGRYRLPDAPLRRWGASRGRHLPGPA